MAALNLKTIETSLPSKAAKDVILGEPQVEGMSAWINGSGSSQNQPPQNTGLKGEGVRDHHSLGCAQMNLKER